MTGPFTSFAGRLVGVLIVACSLSWAAFLLADAWNVAALRRLSVNPLQSVLAFILAATSMVVAFPAFWCLVRSISSQTPPLGETLRLHFLAQLMRHVPGRFLGVAYQVAVARHLATGAQWVGANITHMAMALWFSAFVPLSLLWSIGRLEPTIVVPAIALLIAMPFMLTKSVDLFLRLRLKGRLVSKLFAIASALRACTKSPGFARSIAWFSASWVVYACAWLALGSSIAGVNGLDGLVLCAYYSLAWALGFLVVVTPAGLGVRELAFASMASEYSSEVVVYVALAARLGLLSADILLGLISLLFGRIRHV